MIILKWVGDGKLLIPGFAPRDLSTDDIEKQLKHNRTAKDADELKKQLIGTGLYEAVKQSKKVKDGNN